MNACDVDDFILGSSGIRPSGKDGRIAELVEDIFQALERLDHCDYGEKRADRSALSV
jgi:hypothetical protein